MYEVIHQWVIHSLGDKVLKKSTSLALTPVHSRATYLGKKQLTPHSCYLVVRKSLSSVSSAPHPSLAWLCSCSFELPNGTLRGRVCALRQLHTPPAMCCFLSELFTAESRPGCCGWVVLLGQNSALPFLSHTLHSFDASPELEGHFVVKLLATQPMEGLYLTLS